MSSQLEFLAGRAAQLGTLAADRPEGGRAIRLAERLGAGRFLVAVAGEFKRGKSTLINALVRTDVLPVGVLPLTAVATELSFGEDGAVVEYLDGRRAAIDPAEIAEFVSEDRNPGNERRVARVEVRGGWPLLEPGVVLVDTPGVGSVHTHNTESARAALADADGAVLVLSADAPFSEQERDLLRVLAERRAPTFFVLNKIDHLGPGELDEVVRFVRRVLRDELGREPALFPLSARAALRRRRSGPALGGSDGPQGLDGFEAFEAELDRFIQEDLVEERLASAALELARLGASLRDTISVERAALELDAGVLTERVKALRESAEAEQGRLDDDRTLLARDVARLSDSVRERLARFGHDGTAAYRAQLVEISRSAPRATLAADLRESIEESVRAGFDEFRAREAAGVEQAWRELAGRFRSRAEARVNAIRAMAGELFELSLAPVTVPALAEEQEEFFYLFVHVGSFTEPFAGPIGRLLPGRALRRRAERWAPRVLAREFDKHAGRASWDLTQRLDRVRQRFEAAMTAELRSAAEALLGAAERAERAQREADHTHDERVAAMRAQEELARSLAELGDRAG